MQVPEKQNITKLLKKKAADLGFDFCGVAPAGQVSEKDESALKEWLSKGYHGKMTYMEQHLEKRLNPFVLVPGAKSVISVLLNYLPPTTQKHADAPKVSKYALGKDYHIVIKRKLKFLLQYLQTIYPGIQGRPFVDSAPMLDRAWAVKAGLGWIGKNTMLIHLGAGSWFFIGALVVDTLLDYDEPYTRDHCGGCTRCIDTCPTDAITGPRELDATKCISYQTIETKDPVPDELKPKMEGYVFGCDICQDVCPYNKHAPLTSEPELLPYDTLLNMSREDWNNLTSGPFKRVFEDSPVRRAGLRGIRKNMEALENPKENNQSGKG